MIYDDDTIREELNKLNAPETLRLLFMLHGGNQSRPPAPGSTKYLFEKESTPATPTITSGFGREVLRLTAEDVGFLEACGIKVE